MRSSSSSQDKSFLVDEEDYSLFLSPRFEQVRVKSILRSGSQLERQNPVGIPVDNRLIDHCNQLRHGAKNDEVDNSSVFVLHPRMIVEGERNSSKNKSKSSTVQQNCSSLDNQTDKIQINQLKCMLTMQLKHKSQNARAIHNKYQQYCSEQSIDQEKKLEKIDFSEDFQNDEDQLHSNNQINFNSNKQSKQIYQEDRVEQEQPWKPLNKFRNFSFETDAAESSQGESKSNVVKKTNKKRHIFRPIFSAVLSKKGAVQNPSVPSSEQQEEDKNTQSSRKDSDSFLFAIKNTLFMQQRSLFTNEIIAQKHKDLLAQKPTNCNNTKQHSHRLLTQSKTVRPLSCLTNKKFSQDRSSHSQQPRIHATQKNPQSIMQHQNSVDIHQNKRQNFRKENEEIDYSFISPSKLLPYLADGISTQSDQFQPTNGFQTNSCPNTGGIMMKSRVKIVNHNKNTNITVDAMMRNKRSSSLSSQDIQTSKPTSSERENIQEMQVKHIPTTPKRDIIHKNLEILVKLSPNDINLTPEKQISISKTEVVNRTKDKKDKSRSCSRSDLFDQITNSSRQNSLHLELHLASLSAIEEKQQKQRINISNVLHPQSKNQQKISHRLSILQQNNNSSSTPQRKGISLTPLSDLPVYINKFVFSEENTHTLDGMQHLLQNNPHFSSSSLQNLSVC